MVDREIQNGYSTAVWITRLVENRFQQQFCIQFAAHQTGDPATLLVFVAIHYRNPAIHVSQNFM